MVYVHKQVISYQIDDIQADEITADQFTGTHVGDVVAVDGTKLVDGTLQKMFAPSGFVGNLVGNASTVTNGVYTVGDQSIAGVKTLSDSIVAQGGINTAELRDSSGTNAIVISDAVGASAPKVTVLGELVVQGDSTILNTNIVAVEDTNITLAKNNVTSSALVGSGLTISGGTGDDIVFQYSAENVMSLNIGMDLLNGDLRVKDGDASISGSLAAVSASITGSIEASDITADVKAQDSSTMLDGGSKTLNVDTVVAPSITGDVTGTVSDISNHNTDALAEGTSNLYYTNTRVHAALYGGTGVTYDGSGQFSIGQPVGTSDSVTFNNIEADGNLVSAGDVTVNGGKVYVKGAGVGIDLNSEQANNGMLRFHTSAGQTGIISTTNGNAPIQVYASLLWARAINGGTGNAQVDGDLQVDGTISGPTITSLQNATSSSVAAEEAARIAADNVLQGNIDTVAANLAIEESQRKAEDATLQSNIDAEEAARIAADNTLQSNIDSEEAARISGDASTLVQATAYTDQEIAALVAAAPATLDTLKEIATALGDDPNLSTTLTNQIAGVQSNLDAEIATTDVEVAALQAQDVVLQSNINTEITNRTNADNSLQGNINTVQSNLDTEKAARIAADGTLQTNIDAEAATRASADTTLQNNINTVASNLAAEIAATNTDVLTLQTADATLQTNIDNEESSRLSADTTLQTNITAEAATRAAADSTLQTNLDTEAATRLAADTTLQANIDSEEAARIAADSTLQSNINSVASDLATEISDRDLYFVNELNTTKVLNPVRGSDILVGNNIGISPATGFATQFDGNVEFANNTVISKGGVDLTPTFAELNFVDGATSNIQDQIDALSSSTSTDLAAEEAARIAGDASTLSSAQSYTDTAISNLVDNAPAALDTLNEIAAALADDANFATTITNQVTTVQTNLDAEAATRLAADNNLQSGIDTVAADLATTDTNVTALQNEVDAIESGAGLSASGTYLSNSLGNYINTATSLADADDKLDAALKAEETSRTSADTTLQANIDTVAANLASEISTTNGEVSALQATDTAIQAEVDAVETGAGLSASGSYLSNSLGNYIASATSLADADNKLDAALKAEETSRASADTAIQAEVDTIESSAGLSASGAYVANSLANYISTASSLADADDKLDAALKAEETSRSSADTTLQSNIDTVAANLASEISTTNTEVSALQSADVTLQSNIDTEEAARISGDASTLSSAQAYTDTAVAGLIDAAPAALDTLNELAAALGDDANFATTITNQITAVQADVDQNEADADAAIAALQADVDQNEADADAAIALKADIASPTFTGTLTADVVDVNGSMTTGNINIDAGGDDASLTFTLETNGGADKGGIVWTRDTGGADIGAIKYVRSQDSIHFYTNGTTAADVSINSTGTLVANNGITGNLTGNVTGTVSDISNHDTDTLTEGTSNLYYTDTRSRAAISVSGSLAYNSTTGVVSFTERTDAAVNALADARIALQVGSNLDLSAKSTSDLSEGLTNLYYTDARVGSYLTANSYATQSYVDTAVANVVDAAPATLDTLNELAAALGDDPNFATTTTNLIGTKLATADFSTTFDSNLAGKTTDNLTEGTTNVYYTDARSRGAISVSGDLAYNSITGVVSFTERTDSEVNALADARIALNTGSNLDLSSKDTDDLSEGLTNVYYTDTRSRSAISVSGDLAYNSTTGVISFTERTDAEVNSLADARIALNTGSNLDLSGKSTSDLSEGLTNLYYTDARADARVNLQTGANLDLSSKTTDDLGEGLSNQYYTDSRARGAISVSGDLSYNSTTGVISFTERTDAEVNGLADARVALNTGANLDLSSKDTDDLSEGTTNLYFTEERVDDRVNALLQTGVNLNTDYDDANNTLTIEHDNSHYSLSYDDANNGTSANDLPINRAEVILDIAAAAKNDVYLNLAKGTAGQLLYLTLNSTFSSAYLIYIEKSGGATHPTNIYSTISFSTTNRTAVLRYNDTLGLWVIVGGDANSSY